MVNRERLLMIACLVGFIGDAILQVLVYNNMLDRGLKQYFQQHGRAESTFIAGGMITVFYVIYFALKLPLNFVGLAIYGVILDFIFRKTRLFPSLDGYYKSFGYIASAVWGAIPLMVPLAIEKLLEKFDSK